MNRRDFLKSALAAFGFSILPGAKTYDRLWTPKKEIIRVSYHVQPLAGKLYDVPVYEHLVKMKADVSERFGLTNEYIWTPLNEAWDINKSTGEIVVDWEIDPAAPWNS